MTTEFVNLMREDGSHILVNYSLIEAIVTEKQSLKIKLGGEWINLKGSLEHLVRECQGSGKIVLSPAPSPR